MITKGDCHHCRARTATPEAEIEELLRFETLRQWNFDLFR